MNTTPTAPTSSRTDSGWRSSPITVVAESAYPEITAAPRVRVVEMGAHLQSHGVEIDFRPSISNDEYALISRRGFSPAKTVALLRSAARATRSERNFGALTLVHRLRSLVPWPRDDRPLDVYDFDDALYLGSGSSRQRRLGALKLEARRCINHMSSARLVLAGNHVLADAARQHAKRIEVVPSCVDPALQALREHRDVEVLTLGWIGSATTSSYLRPLLAVIGELHARGWPIRLVLMGASGLIRAPWIEHRPWSLSAERRMLTEVDVGLMPLPDDPWARGKCGYKLLRYFSAGVPAIASPVGVNTELIKGGGGLSASSPADWSAAIAELAGDALTRREIGKRARRFVEREYSYQAWAPRVAALFKELAGGR